MEYTGWLLLIVLLFVAVAALVGGKVHVGPKGVSFDTKGVLDLIQRARQAKGLTDSTPQREPEAPKRTTLPVATVLWIDDVTAGNIFERKALAKLGVHVECYTSNRQAEQVFDRVNPDIVISDIGRPHGEPDGFDLLDRIRAKDLNLPFLFYTGAVTEELERQSKAKGANGLFADPVDLIATVSSRLPR